MDIRDQLEQAKAEVARLERMVATRPCHEVGHRWKSLGGCNAACDLGRDCSCSAPVNTCEVCGDCDYGENDDAIQTRAACAERREFL